MIEIPDLASPSTPEAFEDRFLKRIEPCYDPWEKANYFSGSVTTISGESFPMVVFLRRTYAERMLCSLRWQV